MLRPLSFSIFLSLLLIAVPLCSTENPATSPVIRGRAHFISQFQPKTENSEENAGSSRLLAEDSDFEDDSVVTNGLIEALKRKGLLEGKDSKKNNNPNKRYDNEDSEEEREEDSQDSQESEERSDEERSSGSGVNPLVEALKRKGLLEGKDSKKNNNPNKRYDNEESEEEKEEDSQDSQESEEKSDEERSSGSGVNPLLEALKRKGLLEGKDSKKNNNPNKRYDEESEDEKSYEDEVKEDEEEAESTGNASSLIEALKKKGLLEGLGSHKNPNKRYDTEESEQEGSNEGEEETASESHTAPKTVNSNSVIEALKKKGVLEGLGSHKNPRYDEERSAINESDEPEDVREETEAASSMISSQTHSSGFENPILAALKKKGLLEGPNSKKNNNPNKVEETDSEEEKREEPETETENEDDSESFAPIVPRETEQVNSNPLIEALKRKGLLEGKDSAKNNNPHKRESSDSEDEKEDVREDEKEDEKEEDEEEASSSKSNAMIEALKRKGLLEGKDSKKHNSPDDPLKEEEDESSTPAPSSATRSSSSKRSQKQEDTDNTDPDGYEEDESDYYATTPAADPTTPASPANVTSPLESTMKGGRAQWESRFHPDKSKEAAATANPGATDTPAHVNTENTDKTKATSPSTSTTTPKKDQKVVEVTVEAQEQSGGMIGLALLSVTVSLGIFFGLKYGHELVRAFKKYQAKQNGSAEEVEGMQKIPMTPIGDTGRGQIQEDPAPLLVVSTNHSF